MNEWVMVAIVVGATVTLMGGFGWMTAVLRGRNKQDKG